jgi:hypothetical protein
MVNLNVMGGSVILVPAGDVVAAQLCGQGCCCGAVPMAAAIAGSLVVGGLAAAYWRRSGRPKTWGEGDQGGEGR